MASNTITTTQEFINIINSGRVIVIDFHATWSGYSQFLGQQLSDFAETLKRLGIDLYRVNIDDADDVVIEADVRVVPTFMVFKDGKRVGTTEGVGAGSPYKFMIGEQLAGSTGGKIVASEQPGTEIYETLQ